MDAAATVVPPTPPPPPATLTREEFARQRLELDEGHDAYFARCCTPAERSANPADRPRSAADRAIFIALAAQETGDGGPADGRRFDGAEAAACIAALRRSRGPAPTTCMGPDPFSIREVLEDAIPSCRSVYVGTAAVGARCGYSDDCVPTAYCLRPNPRIAGRCVPRIERSAACQVTTDSCQLGDECVRGHCGARLGLGASCELPTDCARSARCSDAHFCVRRAFAADGAACTDNADCRSDHCAQGRCQPFCSGRPAP